MAKSLKMTKRNKTKGQTITYKNWKQKIEQHVPAKNRGWTQVFQKG